MEPEVPDPSRQQNIVRLVPTAERDRQQCADCLELLNGLQADGKVSELVWLRFDAAGNCSFVVSKSMTLSHLAMAVAYLQAELHSYIAAQAKELVQV